jgi:hypothetical protein
MAVQKERDPGMRLRWTAGLFFLQAILLVVGVTWFQDCRAVEKKPLVKPIKGYQTKMIHGFTVLVSDEVIEKNDEKKWARTPLEVLDLELGTIVRVIPAKPVDALRKILIWVEWEDKDDPEYPKAVAKYYGVIGNRALWSFSKKKHPLKANNIEIVNMKSLTREHQPRVKFERCVLLHELSHAVHHQLVGVVNVPIRTAYQQAMARKLYEETKDVYGRKRKPYARTNEREYFAELTCAYLDKLHYFPFNAKDLKEHDPVGYKLMEATWGTRKKLEASLKAQTERMAAAKLINARKQRNNGKKVEAMQALERLIKDFPGTKAAGEAEEYMEIWKK